jgi:uncharacterized protein Yka (UPF0111/DUF47 family)
VLKKFLPKEEGFFENFQGLAEQLVKAASQFSRMLTDLENADQYALVISECEAQGDAVVYSTLELLHKTFITPFDRYDIHNLTSGLDDILDAINRSAKRFPMYRFSTVPQEAQALAKLALHATELVKKAVKQLSSLKNDVEILNVCSQLNAVESAADHVLLAGMANLFEQEMDFKQLLKTKELYEHINKVINACQDTGNLIKGIVLEYS